MWARLDDGFPDHPKVVELSDKAFRAHVTAICYSARQKTDGVVSRAALATFAKPPVRKELVAAGLWNDHEGGGIEVHDFLEYHRSRKQWEAERQAKSEAGKRTAALRWGQAEAIAGATAEARGAATPPRNAPDPTQPKNPIGELVDEDQKLRVEGEPQAVEDVSDEQVAERLRALGESIGREWP